MNIAFRGINFTRPFLLSYLDLMSTSDFSLCFRFFITNSGLQLLGSIAETLTSHVWEIIMKYAFSLLHLGCFSFLDNSAYKLNPYDPKFQFLL